MCCNLAQIRPVLFWGRPHWTNALTMSTFCNTHDAHDDWTMVDHELSSGCDSSDKSQDAMSDHRSDVHADSEHGSVHSVAHESEQLADTVLGQPVCQPVCEQLQPATDVPCFEEVVDAVEGSESDNTSQFQLDMAENEGQVDPVQLPVERPQPVIYFFDPVKALLPELQRWFSEAQLAVDVFKQNATQAFAVMFSSAEQGQAMLKQAYMAVHVSVVKKLRAMNLTQTWILAGLTVAATASCAGLLVAVLKNQSLNAALRQRDKELGRLMLKVLHMQDQWQHHFRQGPVLRHTSFEKLVPNVLNH